MDRRRGHRRAMILSALLASCMVACSHHRIPKATLDSQLLKAAEAGDIASVHRLLKQGADVESKYPDGTTALMVAAQYDRTEVVRLLIDKGANVAARNTRDESAISGAAEFATAPTLQLLLDRGADPTVPYKDGGTPLLEAAERENTDAIALFLRRGATTEQKNQALAAAAHGLAVMIIEVATSPDGKPVKSLRQAGRDPDSASARTIKLLLQNGAQIESTSNEYGEDATPLIIAATYGETDAVNALLQNDARVDARDKYGNTALIAAACLCAVIDMPDTYESVRLLLENHADPNARNSTGRTALMTAVDWSRTANMQLLIDHGADVNVRDNEGNTALMNAASGGAIDKAPALKLLLRSGADARVRNNKGKTALAIARENHQDDAVHVLEKLAAR
jgi:uncharacterized protein